MRANLVITGLVESQGENCVEVVQNFFHKNLKIIVETRVNKLWNRLLLLTPCDIMNKLC